MLQFLNPLMLAGLGALSVPILIHLISRWRAPQYEFPTVRFLEQVKIEATRMQKLKHLILLLIRILLVTFIVLAFSRPFLAKKKGQWVQGASKAVVIIIDNSYSMGYDDNLNKAKEEAMKIIGDLSPIDKVAVLTCSNRTKLLTNLTEKSNFSNEIINKIDLSFRQTDFEPAIKRAEEVLLDVPVSQKFIYLLTDNQVMGWQNYDFSENLSPGIEFKIKKFSMRIGENTVVNDLELDGNRYFINNIKAKTMNYRDIVKEMDVELVLDGNTSNQRVSLEPNMTKIIDFNVDLKLDKMHEGYVKISDDELNVDNKFYFAVKNVEPIPVLVIADGEKDILYLMKALSPTDSKNLFNVKIVSISQLEGISFEKFRVIFCINIKRINNDCLSKFQRFVQNGGGLIVVLGDKVDIKDYNSKPYNEIMPATFLRLEGNTVKKNYGIGMVVGKSDSDILSDMVDPKYADWSGIHVFNYVKIDREMGDTILAYENGDPSVLERSIGSGKVLLFTTSFDRDWNNFVLSPLFLPLVHQSIYSLSNIANKSNKLFVGEFIVNKGNKIISPDNQEFKTGIEAEIPGIYKTIDNEGKTEKWVVNVNSHEGNLSFNDTEDIETRINSGINNFKEVKENYVFWSKKEQEQKQRWWWYCILLAILLGTIEMIFANYDSVIPAKAGIHKK